MFPSSHEDIDIVRMRLNFTQPDRYTQVEGLSADGMVLRFGGLYRFTDLDMSTGG